MHDMKACATVDVQLLSLLFSVKSLTRRPLYPPGRSHRHRLTGKLGGPQSRSGRFRDEMKLSGLQPGRLMYKERKAACYDSHRKHANAVLAEGTIVEG
jgi:hypothetical protein